MANSILDRARVAVLGKVNDLLDDVANTPSAYKQRIRDLESAMADLRASKDEAVGSVSGYARQVTEAQSNVARTQADIDDILGDGDPSNDDAAVQLQLKIETLNDSITTNQGLQADAQATADALDQALQKLENKHREMVNGLDKLTLTAASANARNRASHAVEAAQQASDAAGSIDSIQAKVQHDADVANARFDRVFGDMQSSQSPEEAAKLARARAAIEARRTAIAQQASTPETPAG